MQHIVLGTNVLVKQKEALKQTAGGIVVPDSSRIKPLRGTIVKIGSIHLIKNPLKEGDEILFERYAGIPVELDGKEYLVINTEEILIILKKEPEDA